MSSFERVNLQYDGTFADHLEMTIQLGYVILFSSAFPPAALCALLNNLIEIRSDAFKLAYVCQRPFGQRVPNIGTWQVQLPKTPKDKLASVAEGTRLFCCVSAALHGVHGHNGGAGELRPHRPLGASAPHVPGYDGHADHLADRGLGAHHALHPVHYHLRYSGHSELVGHRDGQDRVGSQGGQSHRQHCHPFPGRTRPSQVHRQVSFVFPILFNFLLAIFDIVKTSKTRPLRNRGF